ncbi:unnamed protein product [Trichogramma brassicae]|uniref:Uncharacterized protein n=1 Tax=Trichogramma brassicae TaxID=86971 RepID=A0A6H5J5C0_9HYME|nr:unnamed protein product [Trichogramma brassicae]
MDEKTIDSIFAGSMKSLPPVSSKIVRIFTSSTFTDTTMERNTLMAQCYPKLKDYCREKHGLEFQVVDMRWGVRDEATDDHMTTELCMREIENCQRLSMGPNFVVCSFLFFFSIFSKKKVDPCLFIWIKNQVFLGQKYGYRPIPTYVLSAELEMLHDELESQGIDVSVLDQWYKKDSNAVPACSILQPISSILKKLQQQANTEAAAGGPGHLVGPWYTVEWIGREGLEVETHSEYLQHFITHFYRNIIKLVDRAMKKEDSSAQGQIITEILQHLHACNNSVKIFYGREENLERIKNYMLGNNEKPLVFYGEGGCGKTSLLAKSAGLSNTVWLATKKPISIIRFLGTTPDSSALTPTLISICQQISYNYMLPFEEIPDDLVPLTAHFKHLLTLATSEQPILLFLDSVDQLTGAQGNKLSWLPTRLPANVKMILMWMKMAHRDLNNYQWRLVANAISKCSLPIFVKLVFAEICRWRSYTKPADTHLANTVMDSIMMLFERIEKQHGKILVFHALAYITAAKSGLSESELEDLISLDDKVLDDVYQYHLPPVRRIPPLLWTRIRNDLPNYLSEREADGVSVLNWYHRQFRDAAKERYFKNLNLATYFHSMIADYYLGIWGGGVAKPFKYTEIQRHRFNLQDREGIADRKVPEQPLAFYSKEGKISRYNLRKFGELPFHLVRSNRFKDLFESVLFNYEWLHAKLSSCPLQAVLSDFEDACAFIEDQNLVRELMLVADALRLGGAILATHPDMLAPQLVGRLLPEIGSNNNVRMLLQACDEDGAKDCALMPVYHCLHTPGGPLKYSLEGHQFAVFGFCMTSDYRYLVSISNKFITWDLSTSDLTRDVSPGIEGIMQQLVLSPDNRYAAAFTNNNQSVVLNTLTSEFVIINNPLPNKENVCGVFLLNQSSFIYGKTGWCRFDLRGNLLGNHSKMEFFTLDDYKIIFWTGNLEDSTMLLHVYRDKIGIEPFKFHSAMAMTKDKKFVYACTRKDTYQVTKYEVADGSLVWEEKLDLPRARNDETEYVLQLKLDKEDRTLLATTGNGFVVWFLDGDEEEEEQQQEKPSARAIVLQLPNAVRNISTRMMCSNSIMISGTKDYAVAGVRYAFENNLTNSNLYKLVCFSVINRKNLYVWNLETTELVKVLDAHFARIIQLEALTIGNWNSVITSSIDRSVKVWNINNIFEQVHVIDRHELQIDSISLAENCNLAATVTRGCVGVWDLQTGKLISKLADSPLGAIVTHACITQDGKFIVSVESGNVLIWNRITEQVLFKEEQADVRQLILINDGIKFATISRANNPPGIEIMRTNVTVIMRSIPDGAKLFTFEYPVRSNTGIPFREIVLTSDFLHMVVPAAEKGNKDCIMIYNTKTGGNVSKIPIKIPGFKEIVAVVSMPNKPQWIGIIGSDKGSIMDIVKKKVLRSIPKWSGNISGDGKYTLYAPSRGGLELVELKKGETVKTYIPKVAEGVFTIISMFNRTDEYVLYYHSGRKTIRVFRSSDCEMIANYRVQAELSAIDSTYDGKGIVLGTVDGCLSVLVLADPKKPEMKDYLANLPSRDEKWKKRMEKQRATTKFKAAVRIARVTYDLVNLVRSENASAASANDDQEQSM